MHNTQDNFTPRTRSQVFKGHSWGYWRCVTASGSMVWFCTFGLFIAYFGILLHILHIWYIFAYIANVGCFLHVLHIWYIYCIFCICLYVIEYIAYLVCFCILYIPSMFLHILQIENMHVWFCKVLFPFSFVSQNNLARKQHDCAFVSVLEEYKGRRRPGSIYLHIFYLHAYFTYSAYFFQNGLIGWTLPWSLSARASTICSAYHVHLVQAPIGSSGGQWHHPLQHEGRGCRLWWWVLWLKAWGGGWEPVVVRKLLGNVLVVQDVGLQKQ